MPTEKPPTSARVVALNEDGTPKTNGTTPLGFVSSNGVKLVSVFDMLHAGIRDIRARLDTADLPIDDFADTFEALVGMYERCIRIAANIEAKRRR